MARSSTKKAPKTQKTKITVLINKEIFDKFSDKAEKLGLRRDAYLNQMLPEEIDYLKKVPRGSVRGELVLRMFRSSKESDMVKIGITLESTVAKDLSEVCADKHVVRDEFMEACLARFDGFLDAALVAIYNLNCIRDENALDNLTMSDEEVASLQAKLTELKNE